MKKFFQFLLNIETEEEKKYRESQRHYMKSLHDWGKYITENDRKVREEYTGG